MEETIVIICLFVVLFVMMALIYYQWYIIRYKTFRYRKQYDKWTKIKKKLETEIKESYYIIGEMQECNEAHFPGDCEYCGAT